MTTTSPNAVFERLETRRLLSIEYAGVGIKVTGTDAADVIAVAESHVRNESLDRRTVTIYLNDESAEFGWFSFQEIWISTLGGADTIIIGSLDKPVHMKAGPGDDTLSGGDAADTLLGQGGFDYVFGRDGDDLVVGGLQGDEMIGGTGDDLLIPDSTETIDDVISGGPGRDTVDYSTWTDPVRVSVETEPDAVFVNDTIFPDVELVIGGEGSDVLNNATRFGIELRGGPGNDSIRGGSGNDTLVGGPGIDLLVGLGGRDRFVLDDGEADTALGGSGEDFADADELDILNEIP